MVADVTRKDIFLWTYTFLSFLRTLSDTLECFFILSILVGLKADGFL